MVMRGLLKHGAELCLVRGGVARLARALRREGKFILSYHNVVPDEASVVGDGCLHLRRKAFADQLDLLSRTHEVVALDRLLQENKSGRPRAAITFDDAYAGACTLGVSELASRGLPATFFVSPARLGDQGFWWDQLADARIGVLDPAVRRYALHELRGEQDAILAWASQKGLKLAALPAHSQPADPETLEAMARHPGISLASHTWSHPNLGRLTAVEVELQLSRSLHWLYEYFSNVLAWLAYPYGVGTEEAERAATAAGYRAAVLVRGGWLPRSNGRLRTYRIPRVNVPAGLSLEGFALRVSGIGAR